MAPYNFGDSISGMFSSLSPSSRPAVPNLGGSSPSGGFNASSFLASMAPKNPVSPFAIGGVSTPAVPNVSAITPAPVVPRSPATGGMTYLVQPGDTLSAIAAKHGTTVQAILGANPSVTDPNLIKAGAGLNIPGSSSPAVPSISSSIPTTDGTGTINPHTGGFTSNASGSSAGSAAANGSSFSSPAVPSVPAYNGNGSSPTAPGATPTYTGATGALLANNATNPADTGAGVTGYEQAVQNLAQFEKGLQGTLGDIGRQAIPMPFIQGQQQVVNTENAGILAALQGAVTAAQGGVQLETTGRQTQNTGLAAAGQLTAPTANATFFGTPETGNTLGTNFSNSMAQYAQMAANGQYSAIPSAITSNPILSAQLNAAAKKINPNYSPVTSAAQAAATAANTTLGGTATPTAANTVYQKAYSDYQDLTNYTANVDSFGSLLTTGMSAADGTQINPTDAKYANMTIAQFRGQLSNPAQAQFDSTLAALRAKVSGMLSIGGSETPTALTSDANSIIDGSAPVGTLNATLSRIQQEGNALLQNQATKVNSAKSNITPPSGTNFGTSGNGGSNPFSSASFFGS